MRKQISILIGGVYNSGILADPHAPNATYNCTPARQALLDRARRIDAVCRRYAVPIKAAALQFAAAHPVAAAVLCGARSAHEIEENDRLFGHEIPPDLWNELKQEKLIAEEAPAGQF